MRSKQMMLPRLSLWFSELASVASGTLAAIGMHGCVLGQTMEQTDATWYSSKPEWSVFEQGVYQHWSKVPQLASV